MTTVSILLFGLLLGMKHATEADHLAAVATLATRQGSMRQTLRQGVAWGVGHTLTLMVFGGAVLGLGHAISPALEQALETAGSSLALPSMPSMALGLGYIALFGIGSIAGMALLSLVIAVPLKLSAAYLTRTHRAMTALVGCFSCVLGVAIIVQIGPVQARVG